MSTAAPAERVDVDEVTPEDGRRLFDDLARSLLGLSREEFLQRWDRGEFARDDRPEVVHLATLIPFGR
jgi:hypothetical protein